jgi:hypothetical protein
MRIKIIAAAWITAVVLGLAVASAAADGGPPTDVHHPDCVTVHKDYDHTVNTPVAGQVYIKAGNDHYDAGYHDAGWDVPATWAGKDVSHYDICTPPVSTTTEAPTSTSTSSTTTASTTSSSTTSSLPSSSSSTPTTAPTTSSVVPTTSTSTSSSSVATTAPPTTVPASSTTEPESTTSAPSTTSPPSTSTTAPGTSTSTPASTSPGTTTSSSSPSTVPSSSSTTTPDDDVFIDIETEGVCGLTTFVTLSGPTGVTADLFRFGLVDGVANPNFPVQIGDDVPMGPAGPFIDIYDGAHTVQITIEAFFSNGQSALDVEVITFDCTEVTTSTLPATTTTLIGTPTTVELPSTTSSLPSPSTSTTALPNPTSSGPGTSTPPPGNLPSTGVRADILIVIGVILIGGALLILLYASRQRDEDEYIQ